MPFQVTVIGDANADQEKYAFCVEVGRLLAGMNAVVITGGRSGVMEAVCRGAFQAGGLTVGILPGSDKQEANEYCRAVIPSGMGHGRNVLTVLSADLVIAIGGQAGTLTEMGFAWIYQKPLIAVSRFGGWSEELAGKMIDSRRPDHIIEVSTLEELRKEIGKLIRDKKI